MKLISKTVWKADSNKVFSRISDNIKIGSIINVVSDDSINNYEEVDKTLEELDNDKLYNDLIENLLNNNNSIE